jgi:hypothetical protein
MPGDLSVTPAGLNTGSYFPYCCTAPTAREILCLGRCDQVPKVKSFSAPRITTFRW